MKASSLVPKTEGRVGFSYDALRSVPDRSGCYALAAFGDEILYIGQSENICARMEQHLDDPKKCGQTPMGKAFWLYYKLCPVRDLDSLENGWVNEHILREGKMPFFNKVRPPT